MKSHDRKQSHKHHEHKEHHEHHIHHKSKKKPQISIFIKNEVKQDMKPEEKKEDECNKCCAWFRMKC